MASCCRENLWHCEQRAPKSKLSLSGLESNVGVMRNALERAFRNVTFPRRLPADLGGAPIYVSGSAGLKYLFRSMDAIDPVLCGMATEFVRPNHVVWDVGANIGLFTFASAYIAGSKGQIYAFEADPWLVQLLQRSAAIQPSACAPIRIVPAAVANSCDIRTFNIARRSRASNSLAELGQGQTGGIKERQTVVSLSLDWLSQRLPAPDVLKIDVEGAELEVLTGAKGMLRDKKPIIMCEVCESTCVQVSEILSSLGYTLYDADAAPENRVRLDRAPWNTLAFAT